MINEVQVTDFSRAGILFVTVTKVAPKIIEEAGERFFSWTVEVVTEVDHSWVQQLESTIPSALKYHSNAITEQSSTTISVKPFDSIVRVGFQEAQSERVMFEGSATVLSVKLNLNDKAQVFVGKLRLDHLTLEESTALLDCLGRDLVLNASPLQQSMSFGAPQAKVGQVVSVKNGDFTSYGMVTEVINNEVLYADFGVEHRSEKPTAHLELDVIGDALNYYEQECINRNSKPSWRYLITAIASSDLVEAIPTVDASLVNIALSIQFGDNHV